METKDIVNEITNYLNTYISKESEFCAAMSVEHRTLQQNFTRLCLQWLEHISSPDYKTDARNEQSQKIASELLQAFRENQEKAGFTGETLNLMSLPSKHLSCI